MLLFALELNQLWLTLLSNLIRLEIYRCLVHIRSFHGARDFVNAIPEELYPFLTPLQNSRKGQLAQLSAFTVLESSNSLFVTDSQLASNKKTAAFKRQLAAYGIDLSQFQTNSFKIGVSSAEESMEQAPEVEEGDDGGDGDSESGSSTQDEESSDSGDEKAPINRRGRQKLFRPLPPKRAKTQSST